MFKNLKGLKEKLEQMAGDLADPEPTNLDDPIAAMTEWTPLKGGGTNIRTHRLVQKNSWQMCFKPTIGAILFGMIFFLVGAGVMIGGVVSLVKRGGGDCIFLLLFGLIFGAVGGGLIYSFCKPITFDKQCGAYWKGRKSPMQVQESGEIKECVWLSNIYALQLIAEYIRGNKSSYHSYELNLVMNDGSRINVVDHGSYRKLQLDAEKLAEFLGVPLWDAA